MNAPQSEEARLDVDRIVSKFGGLKAMSELTGIAIHRLRYFQKTRDIPEKVRPIIVKAAHQNGIDHNAFDYITHLVAPVGA